MSTKLIQTKDYLLLIDEEVEIKFNDLMYDSKLEIVIRYNSYNDGCSKILAYRPRSKEAKELDLPWLPPFKSEVDLQEMALKEIEFNHRLVKEKHEVGYRIGFEQGYKAAQSKQFSLEDMKKAIEMARSGSNGLVTLKDFLTPDYSEEEIIQSLSTQQLPKEFVPEYETVQTTKKEDYKYENGNSNLNYIQKLKTINNILQGYYIW